MASAASYRYGGEADASPGATVVLSVLIAHLEEEPRRRGSADGPDAPAPVTTSDRVDAAGVRTCLRRAAERTSQGNAAGRRAAKGLRPSEHLPLPLPRVAVGRLPASARFVLSGRPEQ
ncbi:hypothetical protein GCM10023175_16390 [Pseudonocardia xishanensis]|uniref:Uncharacterized protein n=1 Tax=Pseudonocardia xishanensis TaxID=630995 RepID=A0ABP8RLL7_9PSEU